MKTNETSQKKLSWLYAPGSMPINIKNRYVCRLIRVIGWVIVALLPIYCLVMTEYIHYANKADVQYFFMERTPAVIFSLCVMYLLWFCLFCLVKKGWVATLIYSFVFGLFAFIDYMKYAMTGDYFYPWDIVQQAGNTGELVQFLTVPFPVVYIILIVLGLALTIPVFFSGVSMPLNWKVRYPLLTVVAGCIAFSVSTPQKISTMLDRFSLNLFDMALQTSNYHANGFVGAFTINVLSTNIQTPENYSENAITSIMESYEEQAAEDFSSPDIILVLSETFWDPTELPGTTFSSDPLAEYRNLIQQDGVISGKFYTTALGGGTVRPEFEVLTGLTSDYLPSGSIPWQYITTQFKSYVSSYQEMGYYTMAIHPYTSSFYSRKEAYPLIGFNELHFEDDIYALDGDIEVKIAGRQISDETFADAIQYYMNSVEDSPAFVFGISMENHQPYTDKYDEVEISVENSAMDADTLSSVVNFTQGAAHADQCLKKLVEFIDSRDRDTILVWFGDHLPTLGANLAAYRQTGAVNADGIYSQEDLDYLYSTPFIVYANFELKESDLLHPGTDNAISSYNLMNGVAQLIGAPRTAYMEFLKDYAQTLPYYNIRLNISIDEEAEWYVKAHQMLTYDQIAGKGYSLQN